MEQLSFKALKQQQFAIRLLVLTLCGGEKEGMLREYTGYDTPQQIPPERIGGIKKELEMEIRCLEILGREAYEKSRTIGGKIALYEEIFARAKRILAGRQWAEQMSWVTFRRALAVEMGKQSSEQQRRIEAWARGAGVLDESGRRWGRPDKAPVQVLGEIPGELKGKEDDKEGIAEEDGAAAAGAGDGSRGQGAVHRAAAGNDW